MWSTPENHIGFALIEFNNTFVVVYPDMPRGFERELQEVLDQAEKHASEQDIMRFEKSEGVWKTIKHFDDLEKGTLLVYLGEDPIEGEQLFWSPGAGERLVRVDWAGRARRVEKLRDP